MKKVLVTGATGFLGQHCLPLLAQRGYDIHGIFRRSQPTTAADVQWHQADLLDPSQLKSLVAQVKPTHLLHLAWYAAPGWGSAPENFQWVRASIDLIQAFQASRGERLVVAGSCAEYDWDFGYCSEFRTPTQPQTLYGTCKQALQTLTQAYSESVELSAAWGRIFFTYGPHEHPQRLVASVIRSLLKDEVARCSHGQQLRDYLYAGDVANALVTLLESPVTGPVNIASGQPIQLKEIVYKVGAQLNRADLIELGALPARPQEAVLVLGDIHRLQHEVGWQPQYSWQQGIENSINWWKQNL
ncbi:MAG: NAD(P)-dependent oxidoreductase [Cyanobacteria bacterium P01_G01_bin.38]